MTPTDTNSPAGERGESGESGFTLIELLVVILIIGILAAIALPAFLSQRSKSQDATAKSHVRSLASEIEACWDTDTGFTTCQASLTSAETGLPVGNGVGKVRVVIATATGYELEATSESDQGGGNHTFAIVHNIGGVFERSCAPQGEGGCRDDGTW